MSLFTARLGCPFAVPASDFARLGQVDRGFVERSVAAMRELPGAERALRNDMAERMASLCPLDLVYRGELNPWAGATRERLWLEPFTAEATLRSLKAQPSLSETQALTKCHPDAPSKRRAG